MSPGGKDIGGSMLLILAAIDLLSSALVCGFLLFVMLVGADVSDASPSGNFDGTGNGITVVEILSASGKPQLVDHTPNDARPAPLANDVEKAFFKKDNSINADYLIPNSFSAIRLADTDEDVALRIYSAGNAPLELFLRCDFKNEPISITLDPLSFPASCKNKPKAEEFKFSKSQKVIIPAEKIFAGLPRPSESPIRNTSLFLLSEKQGLPGNISIWAIPL